MTAIGQPYSVQEFDSYLALPENRDRLLELVNGEIVEKVPVATHAILAAWIATLLNLFLMQKGYPLHWVGVEGRHEVDQHNSRLPDVHLTKTERLPDKNFSQMPNLAVEIQSPDDSAVQLRAKAAYYLKNGTQIVWRVYPERREVEVITSEGQQHLTLEDTLRAEAVLLELAIPMSQLFHVLDSTQD